MCEFVKFALLFQSLHSSSVSECPWTHTADIGWLPLALLMTYIFFFNLGYGSMIWITVAEILPIHVRYSNKQTGLDSTRKVWVYVTKV